MFFSTKHRKDASLNGVEEKQRKFKFVKIKIFKDNLSQRIRYRFPKRETIDQLENVSVFYFEIYNDKEFAEAYAAGLYDVNCLRDRWDRDLTPEEIKIDRV